MWRRNDGGDGDGGGRKRPWSQFTQDDDDDDFEPRDESSALPRMRSVPGPLRDVLIKQQKAELSMDQEEPSSSAGVRLSGSMSVNSSGHSVVAITTVFDQGPWVSMCDYIGLDTVSGKLYGGVKLSRLPHTLSSIVEDDNALPKVPQLLVVIKSLRYVDEEIVAVFHDPTGEIHGYFHRDLVEQIGPALTVGAGVVLRHVSVFTPFASTIGGSSESYLNIIPRNLQRVFLPKGHPATSEPIVSEFHAEQDELIAKELAAEQGTSGTRSNPAVQSRSNPVLQQSSVRHTSTELSFLSQRQVVHRNPPARPVPSIAEVMQEGATEDGGKKRKKKKKDKEPAEASGLGRWQWNKLLQKDPKSKDDGDSRSSTQPTASSSSSSSSLARFKNLLSQRNARRLSKDSETGDESTGEHHQPKAPTRVTFALPSSPPPAQELEQAEPQQDDPPEPNESSSTIDKKSENEDRANASGATSKSNAMDISFDDDDDDW